MSNYNIRCLVPVFGEDGERAKDEDGIGLDEFRALPVEVVWEDPYYIFNCEDPLVPWGNSVGVAYSNLDAKIAITSEEEAVSVFCERYEVEVV